MVYYCWFMRVNTLEQRKKRTIEHGEFLADWLNRMKAHGLNEAVDRGVEALSRRPLPPGSFRRAAMRLTGEAVPSEPEGSRRAARGFVARYFLDDTFLFWLCIFCLQAEVGRRKIRKMFEQELPGIRDAHTWKSFLEVIRTHVPGSEKWVESDVIRFRLSECRIDFDATFRSGGRGRPLFEFVAVNERGRALQALGHLIESDDIGRVRECPHCHRFFFAGQRKHKKFCSHRCQTAYWQHTPEGLAYKRDQMRASRERQREEDRRQGMIGERLRVSKDILDGLGK